MCDPNNVLTQSLLPADTLRCRFSFSFASICLPSSKRHGGDSSCQLAVARAAVLGPGEGSDFTCVEAHFTGEGSCQRAATAGRSQRQREALAWE